MSDPRAAATAGDGRVSAPPADGCDETIKRRFIIVNEPGRIPDLKSPPERSHRGATEMLLALFQHRPTATLTVAELTWNDDLWLTDGREWVAEQLIAGGYELPDGKRVTYRIGIDERSLWVAEPGQRPRKCKDFDLSGGAVHYVTTKLFRERWTLRPTPTDDGEQR